MTKLMVGDSIAIASIILSTILFYSGSETRKDKDNKVWIYTLLCLLILIVISTIAYSTKDQVTPKAGERFMAYIWFVLGILASIVYSYSFVPHPRHAHAQPQDAYIISIWIGLATITLGIACFFLHTEFPNSLHVGALEPIAALATSIGGSLTAAAAAADAKLNPQRGMFDTTLKFFRIKSG